MQPAPAEASGGRHASGPHTRHSGHAPERDGPQGRHAPNQHDGHSPNGHHGGHPGHPEHDAGELLTPPDQLRDAAADMRRRAAQLDEVRADLARRCTPAALANVWEGKVAERFLVHVGGDYRQHHLDVAHDRLDLLALALDRAAEANEARLALHRRYRDEVQAELAKRGDLASTGLLPTSLRDTRWSRWHKWVVGS